MKLLKRLLKTLTTGAAKNWITSLIGIVGGAAVFIVSHSDKIDRAQEVAGEIMEVTQDAGANPAGTIMAIALILIGLGSRDNQTTSEESR